MARIIDEHLESVTVKVEKIWDLTIEAYEKAIEAFTENDRKRALKITKDDQKINVLDEEVNEDTIRVITLQAPVASDLRRLISSLKISGQLERIADYTVNIADHVLIGEEDNAETVVDQNIVAMLEHIVEMLKLAKKAYKEGDTALAKEVIEMDTYLDKVYGKSIQKLAKVVKDDALDDIEETHVNMNSILLVKYLERAGDHITNIAEAVYYMVRGKNYDIHHTTTVDVFSED